jgi:hypothetical protein
MRRSFGYITAAGVVGLCVALAGCNARPPAQGGSGTSRAERGRKDAEAIAVSAATAGATAYARTDAAHSDEAKAALVAKPPGPKTTPRHGSPPVVHERVAGANFLPEAEAEKDAREQARELVRQKFAEFDPPLRHEPSPGEVEEYIRKDSRAVIPPGPELKAEFARSGITGNPVKIAYDVEVSAEQVRELRSQARVGFGLRAVAGLVAVSLAGFLFLRADERTKGYLTSWLALGAVTLAGAAAAALMFL